jgi:NodT family efflux transporter outer membrane factor (OMF) lipoprotein
MKSRLNPRPDWSPAAGRLAALAVSMASILAACAPVGPDYVKPELPVADEWSQQPGQGLEPDRADLLEWWKVFEDPVLDELMARARANNNNLKIAGLRVLESMAQLGIATGAQYPQSQFAFGEAAAVSPADNSGVTSNFGQYGLGASASWEIDFWGRFRRGIESADAAYLASIAAFDQALVLLTAGVAGSYAVVRTAEEQLQIARQNLQIQQRSYDITEVLYRNGASSELDMQQAETLLLSTRATLPSLESTLRQARNALSTLLGQPPGSLTGLLAQQSGIPALPDRIDVGIPADMLRRRPDVRQAEFAAMARNAQVGLAEADLYPSFSLAGSIGLSAGGPGDSDFGDLFGQDALTWSIGPSFVWPFLNYGRIKNNVRVQDARLQQALIAYRETALQAAREAEDAMTAFIGSREQTALLAETVKSAERSNALSTLRYQEGFSDYQRVLNAQQSLFAQQQRYVATRGETVLNLVALYKALGGGWESRQGTPWVDPPTRATMEQRTDWGDMLETSHPADSALEQATETTNDTQQD